VQSPSDGREAVDRRSLTLEQEDIVKVAYKANPNTVMVLVSTFPFAINWSQANVPAILHIADNSPELGNGVADVLFGDYNPAGRTNQTWVKDILDLPPLMDYNIRNGRTYMYFKDEPLYPFGYGLSYTTFAYSNVKTNRTEYKPGDPVKISVQVKNTGTRDGDEVVQIYASYPDSKVERPIKQLKGFKREFIKAGEEKTIEITIAPDELTYWDVKKHKFVVEPGSVNLMVGSSSAHIQQKTQITFK
jgi:beta-glucosidase